MDFGPSGSQHRHFEAGLSGGRHEGRCSEIFLHSGYQPTPFAGARRYDETYSPEEFQDNISNRKEVQACEESGIREVTPEENFTKIIELHKAKGPVPFRPTQRDYKRQEKLVSVDSLPEIAFDDGLFKDEADLNGFVRWILRCQAKREAGTLEP